MLRELASRDAFSQGGGSAGATLVGAPDRSSGSHDRATPVLLIVHHGDPRLAALEGVVGDLGYTASVVAGADEAVAAMSRGPVPDVLLTAHSPAGARRGSALNRECLARCPNLRTLYITFVPPMLQDVAGRREVVLSAPFNAGQLAAALAQLWQVEPAAE